MGIVEKRNLPVKSYKDVKINGVDYAMKRPKTRDLIRLEDKYISTDGVEDMYSYIADMCSYLLPKTSMEEICKYEEEFSVEIEGKLIQFNKVTLKESFNAISSLVKMEIVNGKGRSKLNQEQVIEEILKFTDLEFDDLSYNEAKGILEAFQEKVNVGGAMELFETFQQGN